MHISILVNFLFPVFYAEDKKISVTSPNVALQTQLSIIIEAFHRNPEISVSQLADLLNVKVTFEVEYFLKQLFLIMCWWVNFFHKYLTFFRMQLLAWRIVFDFNEIRLFGLFMWANHPSGGIQVWNGFLMTADKRLKWVNDHQDQSSLFA